MSSSSKRVYLVTGSNAGLGFKASLDLAHQPNAHVIMTGRSLERVNVAAERVRSAVAQSESKLSSVVETALLDLSSLESVRKFCASIQARTPTVSDLTILCNAGVQQTELKLTADGFESTFGVNHLGHFLLVTSLLPITKRVVIISSEVHDPSENAPVPPPNVSNLSQVASGISPFDGMEAYATSKLCNLLFMNELIRRYPVRPEAIAYTPGFTPDTELGRSQDASSFDVSKIAAICEERGVPVSTTEVSGAFMAKLCAEPDWAARGWATGMYIRVDEPFNTSEQAKDPKLATELWELSEKLVGGERP